LIEVYLCECHFISLPINLAGDIGVRQRVFLYV
jgi:hypothetical protein